MPALWTISFFPKCAYHVFLSHCAEDRAKLVLPLYSRLASRGIIPWLDQHHYPSGTDPYEALREGVLKCRHVVFLITAAMLRQARGWAVLEKAYGGLLQDNLRLFTLELSHIELPLFFVARDHPLLPRSVWQPLVARGKFVVPRRRRIDWAAQEIERFVIAEQERAEQVSRNLETDPRLRQWLDERPGLVDRVRGAYPLLNLK